MILKFLRALTAFCLLAFSFSGTAYANEDPNFLMGEAIRLYDEAQELTGEDRTRKLLAVNDVLTEIEMENPDNIFTKYIKAGRTIGAIDVAALREELGDIDKNEVLGPFEELPKATKRAISSVAQQACAASDCADEVATSLAEFIVEIAFTDMERLVDIEKLRWLFSNPGQLGGNLERVQVFEQMLDDPDFLADIDARITQGLLEDLEREAAKDFAIGLITNVATEVVAGWFEAQGKTKEAQLARTWIGPSVDIGLALQGAATATTASAGSGAAVIWAKNAYAFVQLGQKTLSAEAAGATRDQQLAKIASDIDSLHRSLLTGRTTGPLFADSPNVAVTPRMAKAFQETLANSYEHQKYWLASEEVILLETFDAIVSLAKFAAKNFNKIADAIPDVPATQPSGTENANSTNALPGDINLNSITASTEGIASTVPNTTVAAGTGWNYEPEDRKLVLSGESFKGVELRSNNSVLAFGRLVLPPLSGTGPSSAEVIQSPNGRFFAIMQDVPQSDGWVPRIAVVSSDPSAPIFAMSARDEVFRFSGSSSWSIDGHFVIFEYPIEEFASHALLVDLRSARGSLIKSERRSTQLSTADVATTRSIGDGIHGITFRHLECAEGGTACGMANIEDAGTTEVRFRLPTSAAKQSSIDAALNAYRDSFIPMCSLPSVQESGLTCPMVVAACEGEVCVDRGPFKARQTVNLLEAPGSRKVVATIQPLEWVFSERAEVWLAPCKSSVVKPLSYDASPNPSALGSILWRLNYLGEGFSVYSTGRGLKHLYEDEFDELPGINVAHINPCKYETRQRWYLIATASGQRGWVQPDNQFDGMTHNSGDDMSGAPQWVLELQENGPDYSSSKNPYELVRENAGNQVAEAKTRWTEAISLDQEQFSHRCLADADIECLKREGASKEAIAFINARSSEGGEGPVVPVDFQELGQVDIAHLGTFGAAGVTLPYFVNTIPESISYPPFPEDDLKVLAAKGDRTAIGLLRGYPDAHSWYSFVGGMRLLPDGGQRLSLLVTWTEFCRACPIVGYNLATVDFDQKGRLKIYKPLGILEHRKTRPTSGLLDYTVDDLRRYPKLIQYFLNIRGYDAGEMDGAIGPRTRSALADFQRENGINSGNGQLDRLTLAALVDSETMFSNGYEGEFTSTQQEQVTSSEFQGCVDPGRVLTTSEIIDLYSGATISDSLGRLTRYNVIPGENTFAQEYGVQLGKETQSPVFVGVRNAKICFIESDHEFCHSVSICNSNDAEYILTPNGGEAWYITKVEPGTKLPASCSSPDSLLSKGEILATLAGKKLDTRPGGNRYVFQSFSEYDSERDRGTVTLSDDRGSFDKAYFASDGELCTQNLLGGSKYCEQVRRCDYEGSGPKIGFFDGDKVSTYVVETSGTVGSTDSSTPGLYDAPDGYKWLQLASRRDLEAARDFVAEIVRAGGAARIFQANKGWFAITATSPDPMFVGNEEEILTSQRSVPWIPGDAFFVEGESYVNEFPIKNGDAVIPAFTKTTTNRDTPMLALDTFRGEWTEGEIIRAGGSIIVWGTPNLETGNCLISGHESVWVACVDTIAFENSAPPETGRAPAQNKLKTEDFYSMFESNNGDDYMTRLVGATRWKDTPEQRASLLLVVKAAISRDEEYTATRKASILLNVMHEASKLAGGDGDLFRIMNYARNSKNGEHPSIGTVLESGSSWKEADDKAKEFHIIDYDNPDDVRKFTHPDGREAVFFRDPQTGQWEIMHDGTNDATYNLVNGSLTSRNDFYQHMLLDVVPWIVYGVSPDDKTSPKDRLETFEQSGPLAVATRLYPFLTKTGAELTSEVLEKLPSESQMTGPLRAWLLYKGQ